MQYEALASETAMLASAGDLQRLDYFLLRAFETEEIWGLKQGSAWFRREIIIPGADPIIAMPLWPYRKMAMDAALDSRMLLSFSAVIRQPARSSRGMTSSCMPAAMN